MPFPRFRGRALLSSLLVWCTLFTPVQGAFATDPSPRILIGEVQWSGSSRSTADEWLELWNVSSEPVSLNGWSLVGGSERPIFFASTTVLAPQQILLIANYAANADKTLLVNQTITIATSSLSLANDRLTLELRDQTGLVQDSVTSSTKPPAGSSSPVNASMIRTRTVSGWSWKSATSIFFVGAPDLGTPGVCDECSTPVSTPPQTEPEQPAIQPPVVPVEEPEEALEPVPETDIPELDPEEADLYGVTPIDHLEEQQTEPINSDPYESPSLGTSTPALPELPETSEPLETTHTSSTENLDHEEETPTISTSTSTIVVTTSSTEDLATSTSPIPETTASTSTINITTSSVAVAPPVQPLITQTTSPLPPPSLNPSSFDPVITEIMAAPGTNDTEWIELRLPDGASPLRYIDWKLQADGKSVFAFTAPALQALNPQGGHLLLAWKTAKLKNTGATLRLIRADGTIAQEVRYGNSTKGTSWIRDEVSGSWKLTRTPTKGATNVLEAVLPAVATTNAPASTPKEASTNAPNTAKKTVTQTRSSTKAPESSGAIKSLELAAAAKTSTSKTESTSAKKSTSSKTTATKPKATTKKAAAKPAKKASTKSSLILPTTVTHFEHIPPEQLSPKVRVRLQGLVGSTVGVFGKQKFVLLAPDGRGLLVKTTTDQPSPELGMTIELTGQLFANDEGVQLQMQAGDRWKTVPLVATTTPRLVDWTAPGLEDQWSFTKLEGLVTDSRAASIVLESQIGEVTIPIKAIVGYRAQRVKTGDTIEVSGIFDGRSGLWKIHPSKASDIVILKHPEPETKAAATSPSNTKLPWNAIGIAVGSIGAIEGIRRWLERRKATLQAKATPATILGA